MHNALHYASLFIGDSQTMTAEAAILGTPAVRFSDFVGKLSYLEQLEHEHHLCFGFDSNQENALIKKVLDLVGNPETKSSWLAKRKLMLDKTSDVRSFIVELLDKYPSSLPTGNNSE
ncbi:MAG: hypothetical protein JKY42_10720 [Flavobacteriales bacterium]|nr:hypothetical protein [Flavobacteriales bacterium]